MVEPSPPPSLAQCFETYHLKNVTQISKDTPDTFAWFASTEEHDFFCKLYPHQLVQTRAAIEIAIAEAHLHPAIIPLRHRVPCSEGILLLYDRVSGVNLGPMEPRNRFQSLPLPERLTAVSAIFSALTAICEAGFMVVDWYEGNMIYDFVNKQIWLFDWELCQRGDGFTLEMDSNYGSSRLMAPEEFIRGSWLDQQTLVFNLGRYALLVLPELAERAAPILARATYPARSGRYQSIREFTQAFINVVE
jgi:serine/threonine protein kinase, bacterial